MNALVVDHCIIPRCWSFRPPSYPCCAYGNPCDCPFCYPLAVVDNGTETTAGVATVDMVVSVALAQMFAMVVFIDLSMVVLVKLFPQSLESVALSQGKYLTSF